MSTTSEIQYHISIQKLQNGVWNPLYCEGDLHTPIYPASIAKIFVGAEVLRQVEAGVYGLGDSILIQEKNIANFLESEFPHSIFPVLKTGNSLTIEHLLYVMLNRSDNTATNELIDLVTRESINENTIQHLSMHGSEITRKYCTREQEYEKYKHAPITMIIPKHAEIFFQKLHDNNMHSLFVSTKLKEYMNKLTGREQLSFLDGRYVCTYKGGHHTSKMRDGRNCMWRHYVMMVDVKGVVYSVVFFSMSKSHEDMSKEIEGKLKELFDKYIYLD